MQPRPITTAVLLRWIGVVPVPVNVGLEVPRIHAPAGTQANRGQGLTADELPDKPWARAQSMGHVGDLEETHGREQRVGQHEAV